MSCKTLVLRLGYTIPLNVVEDEEPLLTGSVPAPNRCHDRVLMSMIILWVFGVYLQQAKRLGTFIMPAAMSQPSREVHVDAGMWHAETAKYIGNRSVGGSLNRREA